MDITLRPMTQEERLYSYTQSSQIRSQTGNIGHLRAYYESNGTTFCSTWFDFRKDIKTQEFMEELDDVIGHYLLDEESGEDFLFSRSKLSKFCFSHPEAADQDLQGFFFRADTEDYSYLLRLNPNCREYCMYCYCYRRDWLDQHLQAGTGASLQRPRRRAAASRIRGRFVHGDQSSAFFWELPKGKRTLTVSVHGSRPSGLRYRMDPGHCTQPKAVLGVIGAFETCWSPDYTGARAH